MSYPLRGCSNRIFRFFWEIYLTAFTIFFRAGGADWTPGIHASKGAVGVTLIQAAVFVGIACWVGVATGARALYFPTWVAITFYLILGAANAYLLVICRHGISFEREFSNLTQRRKTLLLVSSVLLMVGAIAFFVCAASAYRKLPAQHLK